MNAQTLYDLRTFTGWISVQDLRQVFMFLLGDPSPSGKTEIDQVKLDEYLQHDNELEAVLANEPLMRALAKGGIQEKIAAAIEMLEAEAANSGHSWRIGDTVYVNTVTAIAYSNPDGEDVYTDNGGINSWPNTDISVHSFNSVEEAMKYVIERGGEGVSDDLMSYYVEF
jgi:hypothetical protein